MTKAQVEASPPIAEHAPVSRQMEWRLYRYYGSDPLWGNSYFGAGGLAAPLSEPGFPGGDSGVASALGEHDDSDQHLRSAAEVKGYHIHASDGEIGHAENCSSTMPRGPSATSLSTRRTGGPAGTC